MKKISFLFCLLVFCIFCKAATPVDELLNRVGGEGTADRFITAVTASADGTANVFASIANPLIKCRPRRIPAQRTWVSYPIHINFNK